MYIMISIIKIFYMSQVFNPLLEILHCVHYKTVFIHRFFCASGRYKKYFKSIMVILNHQLFFHSLKKSEALLIELMTRETMVGFQLHSDHPHLAKRNSTTRTKYLLSQSNSEHEVLLVLIQLTLIKTPLKLYNEITLF